MIDTLDAVFDGKVFRPTKKVHIKPNTLCRITVEPDSPTPLTTDVWDLLDRLSGTVEAPEDWSAEHDHYLYGTAKKAAS